VEGQFVVDRPWDSPGAEAGVDHSAHRQAGSGLAADSALLTAVT
jgi:hypothetical protein